MCAAAPWRSLLKTQASWGGGAVTTYRRHGCDPPPSDLLLDRWPAVFSLGRLLILAWLIIWISTVPLFHIHIPDATDRWSALQSGGVHTVLTPDLPGEFCPPSQDRHQESPAQIRARAINSPELGFILIGEEANNGDAPAALNSLAQCRAPALLHQLALALAASRAPPHSVCA